MPGDSSDKQAFSGIGADEVVHFTGTEPFWGGQSQGGSLTYTTPDDPQGITIAVERFAGRGGLALSGKQGDKAFDMMVTPGECSDGMSGRTYPFTVTLQIAELMLNGCGWSDRNGFTELETP